MSSKKINTVKKILDFQKSLYQTINAESNDKNITISQFIKRWVGNFPYGATARKSAVAVMEIPEEALTSEAEFDKFFELKKQEFVNSLFFSEEKKC